MISFVITKRNTPMPVQQSSGKSDNTYLDPGFYSKPENQFWNKPHQVSVDKNGHVDTAYATNNKGRDYFEQSLLVKEAKEKRYRAHNL
jgi:hypothetical protein